MSTLQRNCWYRTYLFSGRIKNQFFFSPPIENNENRMNSLLGKTVALSNVFKSVLIYLWQMSWFFFIKNERSIFLLSSIMECAARSETVSTTFDLAKEPLPVLWLSSLIVSLVRASLHKKKKHWAKSNAYRHSLMKNWWIPNGTTSESFKFFCELLHYHYFFIRTSESCFSPIHKSGYFVLSENHFLWFPID